jgi:hypothetical protein
MASARGSFGEFRPRSLRSLAVASVLLLQITYAAADPATPTDPKPAVEASGGGRQLAFGSAGLAGVSGRVVLSAERLVSFSSWSWTADATVPPLPTASAEASGTNLSLLGFSQLPVGDLVMPAINPYAAPRIAVDVFVLPNVTVGGSLGYASISGSTKDTAPKEGSDVDLPTTSAVVLAPRFGVAFTPSEWVSIWIRAGITYSHASEERNKILPNGTSSNSDKVTVTWDQTAISLEPMLVFTPFSHFGIALGPTLDIPVTSSVDSTAKLPGSDVNFSLSNYGATGGILGFF